MSREIRTVLGYSVVFPRWPVLSLLWQSLGTVRSHRCLSWSWGLLTVPAFTHFSPYCLPLTHPSLEMNFTRGSFLNVCLTFFNLKHAGKINLVRRSWCLAYSSSSANGFPTFEMLLAFLRVFSVDWMDHGWANIWARQKSHGIYRKGAMFNKWKMGVSWEIMQPSHSSLQKLYNRAIRRKTWEV